MDVAGARKARRTERPHDYLDIVSIHIERLKGLIRDFADEFEDRRLYLTPLGIAISLFVTMLGSTFKDGFGLTGDQWRVVVGVAAFGSAALALGFFVRGTRRQTLNELMDVIAQRRVSPPRHYGITFFRAIDPVGVNHILVYFDTEWDCYLCPFVRLHSDQSDGGDVIDFAADRFGLPRKALAAREIEGAILPSEKLSQATGKLTQYLFGFYTMTVVPAHVTRFRDRTFEVQGRSYRWMTVEEALSHPLSAKRNGDVFQYIRDNQAILFDAPLSIEQPLAP